MNDFQTQIRAAVRDLDVDTLRSRYSENGQFLALDRFLPEETVARFAAELSPLVPTAYRSYLPGHKKGGSVGRDRLSTEAPSVDALYTPALRGFLEQLTGRPLQLCPT